VNSSKVPDLLSPPRNVLVKSLGFSLALALLFTLVANLLPQVEGEAPEEIEVDLGALTMESFTALGESIFNGKGTCPLCHNDRGRAPDIPAMNMVQAAIEHIKDERYKGKATDAESYIRESMIDPGIYVVAGFGKKGSNDTVSPMPAIDKAPIELTDVEINAVIAYLQAKDGNEITVSLPTETPPSESTDQTAPTLAATPQEVVAKYGCQVCHKIAGMGGDIGPELESVNKRLTSEQIRQSIIDPDADIAKGFSAGIMPQDFAEKMRVKELDMLIHYLAIDSVSTEELATDTQAAPPKESKKQAKAGNNAADIIAQFGCQACHRVLGNGGELGPDLEKVGARLSTEQIRQSIIEPEAVIAQGFPPGLMPPNFAEQMSKEQLDTLVVFLNNRK